MERRNLDGIYFRIKRERWENICFSDLTKEEMEEVMKDRDIEWIKNLCKMLGSTIRSIGDELDIIKE